MTQKIYTVGGEYERYDSKSGAWKHDHETIKHFVRLEDAVDFVRKYYNVTEDASAFADRVRAWGFHDVDVYVHDTIDKAVIYTAVWVCEEKLEG